MGGGGQLATAGVAINATNFPDANFRKIVVTYDTNKDGTLSQAEAERVTRLEVNNPDPINEITSLKGIEYLTALTYLSCSNNRLTALDVSKNTALTTLNCSLNALTALDVSKNTALTSLNCQITHLTALDVSKNTALTTLNCGGNMLTALDVSKNTALTTLNCSSNQLTALDVSKNTALKTLTCSSQNASPLKISTTGDTSYPYQFSFTSYMTSTQIANVSDVQGLDSSGRNIATTYADGVAKFASKPATVKYNYATGLSKTKMDVTITGDAPVEDTKPAITTSSLSSGTTGTSYSQTLAATGTTPITWTISAGSLPTELTLSSGGTISGTPSTGGTFTFTVKAQNSAGNDTKQLTVTISSSSAPDGIPIDADHFPDEIFRGYVRDNFDKNSNGYLSNEEAKIVTKLEVGGKGIKKP